ncbi:unnamed protein product [Parnassius apollo]|uniref:(apollo) hypothetical protein n=1 Tax=Parnassius apollo TaxID=110799 RepID=A0A8S3WF07_PARAO|nr:unnamed protein product [Parnassius apollo]
MNIIKNKQRNRMKLTLLKSILKIRCGIQLMGKCYNNYEIPLNLIKQIGTKESYQSDKDNKISCTVKWRVIALEVFVF